MRRVWAPGPLLALASGLLLTFSFPRIGHPAFAWLALVPLLVAVIGVSTMRAFLLGLLAGFVHFAGTVYWIADVMMVFGGLSEVAAWPVHVAFVAYLALYPALFALVIGHLIRQLGARGLLFAPAVWVTTELGRMYLFTGFPWELLGYSQTPWLAVAQVASVVGVLGLSALVAGANGAVAYALVTAGRERWRGVAVVSVVLVATLTYGVLRLRLDTLAASGAPLRVAAIQGNIAQRDKWDPALGDTILTRYLTLTREAAAAGAALIVWPEAATPFAFGSDQIGSAAIRAVAQETGAHLLFGTTEIVRGDRQFDLYNAAVMLDEQGEARGTYRKQHLVPWGEYVPLRDLLFFVSPLVESVGDFTRGESSDTLPLGDVSVSTAICYEIIYPDLVRGFVRGGSRLLTTVTNDAWYGRSAAPYQHFQQARMRAIEGGRFLVRAANTGISGVIDPYGRVVARTPLFETEVVTADVRLLDGLTVYARFGDSLAYACAAITAMMLWVTGSGRRRRMRGSEGGGER